MPEPRHIELIARALIVHHSRVLMCRNTDHNYLYLPGGHVEFAEPAAHALKRELMEELNLPSTIGDLVLISEHSFTAKHPHHEINLVFHVEHLGDADPARAAEPPTVASTEPGIEFDWIDLAAVQDHDIRPPEILAWLAAGAPTSDHSAPLLSGMTLPIPPEHTIPNPR